MPDSPGTPQLATLEDYLSAIRERRLLVLVLTLLFGVFAFMFASNRSDTYEAQAVVLVGPTPVGSDANRLQTPNLERERSVVESERIAIEAGRLIGEDEPAVMLAGLSVRYVPDSDVLSLTYVDEDAEAAAARVNAIAESYVADREGQSQAYYEDQIALLTEGLADSSNTIDDLDDLIEDLLLEQASLTADQDVERASVDAELSTARALRAEEVVIRRDFERSLNTIQQSVAVRPESAAVLRIATTPSVPLGISVAQLTIAGLLLGAALGVVLAFLSSRLDRSVRSDRSVADLVGAPVLATVPQLRRRAVRLSRGLVMHSDVSDRIAQRAREEIRRLRSAVSFLLVSRPSAVVVVTSTRPGEGKSTIAANLAVAVAHSGQRTVLVSADLRRPTVESIIGVSNEGPGFTDWLAGDDNVVVGTMTPIDRLTLVPAGPEPANPAELLASKRCGFFFDELRANFDIVIVDSPPVLAAADVFSLVQHSDNVLLVVNDRKTELDELAEAVSRLEQVGAQLLGAVRNGTKPGLSILQRDAYSYGSKPNRRALVVEPSTPAVEPEMEPAPTGS